VTELYFKNKIEHKALKNCLSIRRLMKYQIVLIPIVLLLFATYDQVQTMFFPVEHNNETSKLGSSLDTSPCVLDIDCHVHGLCKDQTCECEKGWITWSQSQPCSYQQSSKMMVFAVSFIVGSAGVDWFVLSRKDSLFILCGILKFLILTGCCIWNPLAATSKSKHAMTGASCLSLFLSLISLIWWIADWIRILLDSFPDGNGAPLV
jgi:hypothetical protein